MATTICIEIEDAVATVWLNGAQQRNALSQATWEAIPLAIAEAQATPGCRAIVLRGSGGNFGAGADIKEFGAVFADQAATLDYFERMETAMRSIEAAVRPTIAVIEGLCYGASVALALACDIRLAASSSSFAITPARLGIIYPYGDVARVVTAIGERRAKTMMYSGRAISAATALDYGMVDDLLDGEFEAGVSAFVDAVASSSPWTIATTRQAIADVRRAALPEEAGYPHKMAEAVTGPDFAEGMRAFSERRSPSFPNLDVSADNPVHREETFSSLKEDHGCADHNVDGAPFISGGMQGDT